VRSCLSHLQAAIYVPWEGQWPPDPIECRLGMLSAGMCPRWGAGSLRKMTIIPPATSGSIGAIARWPEWILTGRQDSGAFPPAAGGHNKGAASGRTRSWHCANLR